MLLEQSHTFWKTKVWYLSFARSTPLSAVALILFSTLLILLRSAFTPAVHLYIFCLHGDYLGSSLSSGGSEWKYLTNQMSGLHKPPGQGDVLVLPNAQRGLFWSGAAWELGLHLLSLIHKLSILEPFLDCGGISNWAQWAVSVKWNLLQFTAPFVWRFISQLWVFFHYLILGNWIYSDQAVLFLPPSVRRKIKGLYYHSCCCCDIFVTFSISEDFKIK